MKDGAGVHRLFGSSCGGAGTGFSDVAGGFGVQIQRSKMPGQRIVVSLGADHGGVVGTKAGGGGADPHLLFFSESLKGFAQVLVG